MAAHPCDTVLNEVLSRIRPSRIPAEQRQGLNDLRQSVVQFLQQRFPLHHERVGEPVTLGSREKGTDTSLDYDLDVFVPFRYGFRLHARGMKVAVLRALQERFGSAGCTVRDRGVSIAVRRQGPDGEMVVDVVPGMEIELGRYKDGPGNEEHKFLVLYDSIGNAERTTNVHRQVRLVKENMLHYRDSLRLLKGWRQHEGFKVSGFALELLVYRAATAAEAPKTGSPSVLLGHVLRHSIGLLVADEPLQDIGAGYWWPDYLGTETKRQLAGRWQKILRAIDKGDPEGLRSFFP